MTEAACSACNHDAHWHRKYGPGSSMSREWRPQGGKRGPCSAFTSQRSEHGFLVKCKCRSYRHAREQVA